MIRRPLTALLITVIAFQSGVLAQAPVDQNPKGRPSPELLSTLRKGQKTKEKACREQKPGVKRTYSFRDMSVRHPFKSDGDVIRPDRIEPAFGPKPKYSRWRKIIPFWKTPVDKYGPSVFAFKKNTGRDVPVNETKRSKRIRTMFEESVAARATTDASSAAFDWREEKHGLQFSQPIFQGWYCNNCWSHASVEAFQLSRQLIKRRAGFTGDFDPSHVSSRNYVVEASVCYAKSLAKEESTFPCQFSWHSETLSYLVTDGLPNPEIPNIADDFSAGLRWKCSATSSVRALTWDYVSVFPHEVAKTEEIKRALVTYGPIISTIVTDDCLNLYGGGVFNELHNNYTDGKGEKKLVDGDHIVLIVGWDDKRGAWLVKNSWGTEWGENGYGWIKYGSNNIGQFAAWILADPEERVVTSDE